MEAEGTWTGSVKVQDVGGAAALLDADGCMPKTNDACIVDLRTLATQNL